MLLLGTINLPHKFSRSNVKNVIADKLGRNKAVYIVSAHKSLDPAAGAGFLAARRPCVACGCLRPGPSCRLVLDFQHMARRHTVGRVHEIEQKKTRKPDTEQVRHED